MPIFTPAFATTGQAVGTAHVELDQVPYALGTFTRNTVFSVPFADTTYRIAFNLGTGVAIPIITVTNKTTVGFTWAFLSITTGTALAVSTP